MKYMLMIFGKQSDYEAMGGKPSDGPAWTPQDIKAMVDHMEAINNDLAESGELVTAEGLAEPAQARLVTTTKDGVPVISDGPYGESKEVLAGFWIVDCENIERATEIAARAYRCPQPEGAPNYPVIVQPIGEAPTP
ncbi:YciI family protein [Allostreptomyces psammosilenae]|uniref:YCII-related domain-containing protein n=1 Tax=Allostreptomyces psammosilenae TaxID=1892865 RepID=A0A853AAC7_9ACTN|nr:YciI family protein [Allostreptomyces psammosilenae]NYI07581.1 hypothetical protein [Allostreptomyces psammosilenae]